MENWTAWLSCESAKDAGGPLNIFGVYQIRIASSDEPFSIARLCAVDREGTIYYGRSGLQNQSSHRTIANRIKEFLRGQHSGGKTYARIKARLGDLPQFRGYRLQFRGMGLIDQDIKNREADLLYRYTTVYGELPPCNSSLPKTAARHDV